MLHLLHLLHLQHLKRTPGVTLTGHYYYNNNYKTTTTTRQLQDNYKTRHDKTKAKCYHVCYNPIQALTHITISITANVNWTRTTITHKNLTTGFPCMNIPTPIIHMIPPDHPENHPQALKKNRWLEVVDGHRRQVTRS